MEQKLQDSKLAKKITSLFSLGYSLIELMLSLAIIAVLLVIATRYYTTTNSSQKVNAAANMLQAVINAAEDTKNTTNSYASITKIDDLIAQGLVPQNFSNPNINPWGGAVNAKSNDPATSFTMTLTNVPQADCLSLAEIMQQKGASYDAATSCNNTTYSATYPAPIVSPTPPNS